MIKFNFTNIRNLLFQFMDWLKIAPMFLADVERVVVASIIAMSRMCGRV